MTGATLVLLRPCDRQPTLRIPEKRFAAILATAGLAKMP
jgi:hypothetical protein